MLKFIFSFRFFSFVAFLNIISINSIVVASEQCQWGQQYSRNMISAETELPDIFDPAIGKNIKWTAFLGSKTYSSPVVSRGKVLIGTNNDKPRDPRHKGDRGVLLCLNEADGSFCWQLVVPKIKEDIYKDWPGVGMVSTATIEEDRVYMVTNRGQVLCLDLDGFSNGNDGPFLEESAHMAENNYRHYELTDKDADIIWLFDLPLEVGVYPHDAAHGSILIDGHFLYVNTSSGLNSGHDAVRSPKAPTLIVLEKKTGRWIAKENEGIGPDIFHSAWSSPALGIVNETELIFYGGANGVVYAFEPIKSLPAEKDILSLNRVWLFDCDPRAPKENVHKYVGNRRESPSIIESMPVFYNDCVYVTVGGDIWWGKKTAWLKCIDATLSGDITEQGHIWSYALDEHCVSTPSIFDGLVFFADCGGKVHCIDAKSGQHYWTHQTKGEIWSSTLVADGKVYVGSQRGDFWILKASKEKKILSSVTLDSDIIGVPAAVNKTLYVSTMTKLYAIEKQ
ncbi:MAG: outer membrane protein assembly factor BamB family protein [Planctomycetota bacterium]|jgi:outer membrane protein assembly factor BamB